VVHSDIPNFITAKKGKNWTLREKIRRSRSRSAWITAASHARPGRFCLKLAQDNFPMYETPAPSVDFGSSGRGQPQLKLLRLRLRLKQSRAATRHRICDAHPRGFQRGAGMLQFRFDPGPTVTLWKHDWLARRSAPTMSPSPRWNGFFSAPATASLRALSDAHSRRIRIAT